MKTEEPAPRLIDAKTTADILGVSLPNLYSYVSRGKLTRVRSDVRGSLFNAVQVLEFANRRDRGRSPENVARASLDFGLAVLDSGLSTVQSGRLYFRDQDAVLLS
ncbi:MAG: hypothetical protein JSR72_20355 [Proteobacteria bacterium]|nr:hypothetical protein [Pseudomonadota bacterium]